MNASRPALPEMSLAAWARTAHPVRLAPVAPSTARASAEARYVEDDDTEQVDDVLFGCSAAVLLAMPLILATAMLVG